MREIKLTNSDQVILVDNEDFKELNQHKWFLNAHGYASRNASAEEKSGGYPGMVLLHRQIFKLKKNDGIHVDHINHNKLDNRRENLRLCTNKQNSRNNRVDQNYKNKSSKYKGVNIDKNGRISANIKFNYKKIFIGYFDTEAKAAKAYDQMARYLFGEFACLNFPDIEENVIDVNRCLNKRLHQNSRFIGVSKKGKKFIAYIAVDGVRIRLGCFDTETEAVTARNKYIIENNLDLKKYPLNILGNT